MSRSSLLALLTFIAAEVLFGALLFNNYRDTLDQRLSFHATELTARVGGIVDSYHRLADTIFQQAINRPEIIALLEEADEARPNERDRMRGRLYRQLFPLYRLLRERHIRVLQFVLTDGSSFLRFNRPDLYADIIAEERPTLAQALSLGEPQQGFENGRSYPGFRYVFPLRGKDDRIVALADFGVAFDAIHLLLQKNREQSEFYSQFLIRQTLLEAVSHPSSRTLFDTTSVRQGFVIEGEASSLLDVENHTPAPAFVAALDMAVSRMDAFGRDLDQGKESAAFVQTEDEPSRWFAVTARPIADSSSRNAGYILAYSLTSGMPEIALMHASGFLAGSLVMALGMLAFRNWLTSSRQLRAVSEHMAEGMYVMDASGQILYVNPVAFELLGYTSRELLGHAAHEIFHVHSGGETASREQCPILQTPLAGEVLTSEHEHFQCKSGRQIRVQVTSSPLREEGQVTGAVVLFRNITEEYEARIRLQQTDIAFQHLAEAVVVTGPDVLIRAVNRAFVNITGYTEQEVLGKNPNVLSSGRHSREFYAELWQTLQHDGIWQGEIWNRRKNGEIYPESVTITAIHDQAGQVLSYVSVFSDTTEQRRKEQRLVELAYHDMLTGLPNRTGFLELFEHALLRAERSGRKVGLLFMDLDHFKHINDSLGHQAGDKLLVQVAKRLRKMARDSDILARIGGDEFTMVLEDLNTPKDCGLVARKLLPRLAEPFEIEERKLFVSASIGISIFPQDGKSIHTLLKNADAAMYRAKQAGRSEFCFFTVEIARQEAERFQLEQDLRHALKRDEFRLLYQPKVDIASQRIVGLEALLRWHRSGRDVLTPPSFLGVASEAGLMPEITAWVVANAARQLRQWFDDNLEPGYMAINLDDDTCNVPGMSEQLSRLIGECGASPEQFEIEITETVILHHANTDLVLYELFNAGFRLAVDDFGTGESSLFRLKQLPVHCLKVDRSFVKDIEDDADDRAIISAIVTMAKSLGMKVVAEGVETRNQMKFLRSIGCDQIQGYLCSRPVPPEQIGEMLHQQSVVGRTLLEETS